MQNKLPFAKTWLVVGSRNKRADFEILLYYELRTVKNIGETKRLKNGMTQFYSSFMKLIFHKGILYCVKKNIF